MASNDDDLGEFEIHVENILLQLEQLKLDIPKNVPVEPITLHSDPSLDTLIHNNWKLECEIEAILKSKVKNLPNNKKILLKLADEKAQKMLIENSRALDYQYQKNKLLEKEISDLKEYIKNAEKVNEKLTSFLENRNEINEYAVLKNRYTQLGTLFKLLRDEFSWYLGTHFSSNDDDTIDFDSLLEKLTKKFLDDPNDPYISMDTNIKKEWIHFLISCHIVLRHPNDPLKFRLADFRLN